MSDRDDHPWSRDYIELSSSGFTIAAGAYAGTSASAHRTCTSQLRYS